MSWLTRLKKSECTPAPTLQNLQNLQNPSDGGFVGFVGTPLGDIEKKQSHSAAANDPAVPDQDTPDGKVRARVDVSPPDPALDRWCWPVSGAMNTGEIDTFTARLARFTDKGVNLDDSEALADRLVIRDRERDTQRVCMECAHLGSGRNCRNWKSAGVAIHSRDSKLPTDLVIQLQHCDGFAPTTSPLVNDNTIQGATHG